MEQTVAVVDDDPGLLQLMETIVRSAGMNFAGWRDGAEFLAAYSPDAVNCLIIDMLLPRVSGHAILDRLRELSYCPPVIMISGASDVPLAVHAMKRGAFDFLRKPFSRAQFLQAIEEALDNDLRARQLFLQKKELQDQLASLTAKEREVLDLLVEGMLNKQIARRLDISVRAVELRRASLFRKMGVSSVVELMRRLCGPEQLFTWNEPQLTVPRPFAASGRTPASTEAARFTA